MSGIEIERMGILNKLNHHSIITRLFLCFILVIIPIMAAGIVMFMWEKQTIKNQIENAALDNVSFLQANMEDIVNNIKILQYNLSNDITLNKLVTQYAYLPNYEYYTLINEVQQRLKVMKNSNNYIEDVVVYIPPMGHTISATYGLRNFDETEYQHLFEIHKNTKYPLIINDLELYTTSIYPFNTKKEASPMYLIQVVLTTDKVKDFLNKFSKYNESDTALYDHSSKTWIYNKQSQMSYANNAWLDSTIGASKKDASFTAEINGERYYVISVYSIQLNVSFIQYVNTDEIFRIPDRYGHFLWIYAVLSIAIIMVYMYIIRHLVEYPINRILEAFHRVEEGNLDTQIQIRVSKEFYYLSEGFNRMVSHLNELIDKVYKQDLYAKKSELKQLQSQINPHFLYNSYFMLHRMIKDEDLENAESLSSYIGKYYQYITRNVTDEVTLEQEFEHAHSYAQIQMMRFSNWLFIDFHEIPDKYRQFMVPRIILQPIIENALQHGLNTITKKGLVRVCFKEIITGLLISVEDNGTSLQDEDIKALQGKLTAINDVMETTGIINVHRRIVIRYGTGSGITVLRSDLGGLRVEILITA